MWRCMVFLGQCHKAFVGMIVCSFPGEWQSGLPGTPKKHRSSRAAATAVSIQAETVIVSEGTGVVSMTGVASPVLWCCMGQGTLAKPWGKRTPIMMEIECPTSQRIGAQNQDYVD